ncbi:MAG: hypothetical protein AAGF04_00730 [Chlamydiota bacterium]
MMACCESSLSYLLRVYDDISLRICVRRIGTSVVVTFLANSFFTISGENQYTQGITIAPALCFLAASIHLLIQPIFVYTFSDMYPMRQGVQFLWSVYTVLLVVNRCKEWSAYLHKVDGTYSLIGICFVNLGILLDEKPGLVYILV